ncbi:hypothetical protein J6590_063625 [Homalodisca vitripennis]|nr:hypothetical protein J6590_063625 [Homalodisca vitripennis]
MSGWRGRIQPFRPSPAALAPSCIHLKLFASFLACREGVFGRLRSNGEDYPRQADDRLMMRYRVCANLGKTSVSFMSGLERNQDFLKLLSAY